MARALCYGGEKPGGAAYNGPSERTLKNPGTWIGRMEMGLRELRKNRNT